jgi:class II lanthipeptide synthase
MRPQAADPSSTRPLLQAASLLAKDIRAQAVETREGDVRWPSSAAFELASSPGPAGSPVADGFWDFYSGNPGVALFLAAYSQVAGEPAYRDLCLRALEPVRDEIRRSPEASSSLPMTIGALVGTSSWMYALLTAGKLLGDATLLGDAHALSALLTPEKILADSHHDLVFGSTGALLVLLALDRVNPAPNPCGRTPLELAGLCARRLIAASREDATPMAGAADLQRSRFGLSHGLAGIALALSRLHRRSRDPEVGHAARRVLISLLQFADHNPPDSGDAHASRGSGSSWCHGSSGLSVAFTEILDDEPDESAAAALAEARRRAVEWTQRAPFSPQDHVCCGNMGRIASLAFVARKTGDRALFETAHGLAHLVLRVAKTRQGFSLDYDRPDASFFRGYAGIAYTLLALAAAPDLPQVIALE